MLNDFAHMGPWEDTPDFPNFPHNSKEIPKQKLLVKGEGWGIFAGGPVGEISDMLNFWYIFEHFCKTSASSASGHGIIFAWRTNNFLVKILRKISRAMCFCDLWILVYNYCKSCQTQFTKILICECVGRIMMICTNLKFDDHHNHHFLAFRIMCITNFQKKQWQDHWRWQQPYLNASWMPKMSGAPYVFLRSLPSKKNTSPLKIDGCFRFDISFYLDLFSWWFLLLIVPWYSSPSFTTLDLFLRCFFLRIVPL